jgi:uncharacterized membrane protein YdcZ (DUF606 family)
MKVFNWKFYVMMFVALLMIVKDVCAATGELSVDAPSYAVVSGLLGSILIAVATWWASTINKNLNQIKSLTIQLIVYQNLDHPDRKIEIGDQR